MIRMFAKRLMRGSVNSGTDRVIAGMSLPSGSTLNNVNIRVDLWGTQNRAVTDSLFYAVEGWLIPVLDPDAASPYDTIWDALVPKDTDIEVMDLDTGAGDATPFYEPGEPDFSQMMDVGLRPERVFHQNSFMTVANGSIATFQDNQTPFAPVWVPGTTVNIRLGKKYRVLQPTVLLFALASPVLDDTTTTLDAAAAEAEWGQVKYIGHVLERAMLHLFGVVEASTDAPWEEATVLLKKHLEPDPIELVAGELSNVAWHFLAKAMFDHSVEGELGQKSISTGR